MKKNSYSKILPYQGLTYDDVVIVPQYSDIKSRDDVDISVEIAPDVRLSVPMIASNMDTVISTELCVKLSELGGIAMIHQFQSIELEVKMLKDVKEKGAKVGASIGCAGDFLERAKELIDNGADIVLMDTPHGHSQNMIDGILAFRKMFGKFPLLAGTIATSDAAIDLIRAGVDAIKVGVGAGHACTTRINAGAGVPQLTAVLRTVEAAKNSGVTIIADAGVKNPGAFAKAIGAGAMAIKSGRIFVSTDEANSQLVEKDGKKFKIYRGEASKEAKEERLKKDPGYRQKSTSYVEGAEGLVPYEGSLESVVQRYAMGLRSAMSYTGARNIKEFQEKVLFMQVTQSGQVEAGAHGLQ